MVYVARHMKTQVMIAALQCGMQQDYNQFILRYRPGFVFYERRLSSDSPIVTRFSNNYSDVFRSNPQAFCEMSRDFLERAKSANSLCALSQDPGLLLNQGVINYNGTINEGGRQSFAALSSPSQPVSYGYPGGYIDDPLAGWAR